MSRTSAREHAFKILYQMQFIPEEPDTSVTQYEESFAQEQLPESDRAFIMQELQGINEHISDLDSRIAGALKGWSLPRLSKVDLSIMRLAVYEILYDDTIPASVSINEAVNLAKRYSQEAAPAFINGVLGSIVPNEESRPQ